MKKCMLSDGRISQAPHQRVLPGARVRPGQAPEATRGPALPDRLARAQPASVLDEVISGTMVRFTVDVNTTDSGLKLPEDLPRPSQGLSRKQRPSCTIKNRIWEVRLPADV